VTFSPYILSNTFSALAYYVFPCESVEMPCLLSPPSLTIFLDTFCESLKSTVTIYSPEKAEGGHLGSHKLQGEVERIKAWS